jgi:hypothetical protein
MNDFPEHCIRGVGKEKYIYDDDTVSAGLFIPDKRTASTRGDGGFETSINWEDNNDVLVFTLEYRDENNHLAFPHGAVRVPRQEIDHVNELESTRDTLTYERGPLPDNPYHGNIVFRGSLPNPRLTMIANILAAASSKVYRRE